MRRRIRTGIIFFWVTKALAGFALERLEPSAGCYLGFNVGENDTIPALSSRVGVSPAAFVHFYAFPLSSDSRMEITNYFTQVRDAGGFALITLEPFAGLQYVTSNDCVEFGNLCAAFEAKGIGGIMIRFAHEMNGSWYAWGQQPTAYKQKFRLLSQEVRSRTTRTALLWAPNYGAGYPFQFGGPYHPQPGSPDFLALDTDGDGVLSETDDMYEPYYPGDDAVDWVGMTIYHWGNSYPWLENEIPLANSFADALTGGGYLPNFYARYAADGVHNKPLAIPETSAFFNTQQPGPGEFAIKRAWWQQVFNVSGDSSNGWDIATHFPKLKCINWFDHYKQEREAQNQWIDWRVSVNPLTRDAFLDFVRTKRNGQTYFLMAPEFQREMTPCGIVPVNLPGIIPLSGAIPVALQVKAPANCDLVIDLLDETFQWFGGTRVPVRSGTDLYSVSFPLTQLLVDGRSYRWSIFLTPTGSNYLNALSWYQGPRPVARSLTAVAQIVAAPPVWLPGSGLPIRLKYTTSTNAYLHVNLLDSAFNWRAGQAVPLSRLDGTTELVLPSRTGLADGPYWLEALLADGLTNPQTPLARSPRVPIDLLSTPAENTVTAAVEPLGVLAGDVFRFVASYSALSNLDLHIDLLDNASNILARAVQPVAGGAGIHDSTISYVSAASGRYTVRSHLAASGDTNSTPLVSAPRRTVEVYDLSYRDWLQPYWGIVLGTDAVAPSQDPDSDQASNASEYTALTDPRSSASCLRASIVVANGVATLSWSTVIGRNYQVFRAHSLPGPWVPLSVVWPGSGSAMQYSLGVPSGSNFYRVRASKP